MSIVNVEGLVDSKNEDNVRVIGTCPCSATIDGKSVCLNGDSIEDVDALCVHPEIIESSTGLSSEDQKGELPLCHLALQVNGSDEDVICVSRQMPVRIRKRTLTKKDLTNALDLFPTDMFSSEIDICTECLYKIIAANYDK